ncbi:MAG: propionyl-CoA synthetase, partial [Gammaproteobacteria bacterium]
MGDTFEAVYQRSVNAPEEFWADAAESIDWIKKWDSVLDKNDAPFYRWFAGGELNTCFNAVDRHVNNGLGEQLALIYDSPITGNKATYTYSDLLDQVSRFAGVLRDCGVSKGDRVIIYMPMVPEAVFSMLACARLGAVHSVVFGGFAANELAVRIDDATPVVLVSASCGLEPGKTIEYKPLLDEAINIATHKPRHCVILQRPQVEASMQPGRDVDWASSMQDVAPADCVPVA